MVRTALLRLAGLIMGIGSKAPTEYGFQSAADSVRDSSTHNQVHYKQTNKQTSGSKTPIEYGFRFARGCFYEPSGIGIGGKRVSRRQPTAAGSRARDFEGLMQCH